MHMQARLAKLKLKLAEKERGLAAETESIEEPSSEYPSPTSKLEVLEQKPDESMQRERSVPEDVTFKAFLGATFQGNMAFEV